MAVRAVPVSVPGKLFLLGEYAVLGGGAALVTDVDRHIHVRPRGEAQGYRVEGAEMRDSLRLPILVKQVLAEVAGLEVDPNQLTVDVGEFYHDGAKLGLGSSAASTVALVTSMAPQLSAPRRFALAWEVHHRLQGGRGSGADIAASTFGGPLAYHLTSPAPPFEDLKLPGVPVTDEAIEFDLAIVDQSLKFPQDLRIDAVWTGSPARSTSFVDGLARTLSSQPRTTQSTLQSISSRARVGIQALRDGDTTRFIDAIRKGDRLMEQLGSLTGLPIITDTHRRIRALGTTTNRVAKPSGAGGGDFTLLIGKADSPVPPSISKNFLVLNVA